MRVVTTRTPRTEQDTPSAVALGYFDGVHLGHAAVIGAARAYAEAHGLRLAVFTFVGGPKNVQHILTQPQKMEQLEALGVDTCYQPTFDEFGVLSPEDFFAKMLLGEYNAKALFCGDNFNFGARRAGNVTLLGQLCRESGTYLSVVDMAQYGSQPVSSSRIRAALAEGDIQNVNAMLGRPYEIAYPVQHGRHLGTTLGFPTINQIFPEGIQPPQYGVYITQVRLRGVWWPSATGFGTRPTVDNGAPSCETFIPGYEGDLYEKNLHVRFFEKIADPQKFPSFEALAAAVQGWAAQALGYFKK